MKSKGKLFVITAPSGAGKSSLIKALLAEDPALRLSISYTTRSPRPGEQNAREYHFVDDATFLAMRGRGEFLESAEVHGYRYGTSKKVITDALARGDDLILEIDWQGARQVRAMLPQMVGIFILPPSLKELRRRLQSRATDAPDAIERRLANAREEVSHVLEFEYIIVNEQFDAALADLKQVVAVIRNTPVSRAQQAYRIAKLLEEFR
jgi:guanylate kinase